MDLTFQVLMQYCSLHHWILLLSPVTSTTGYCFRFGSIPSFFLELFLHWSPVAYWAPNDLGSSSLGILSFCLFILFMGFSRKEYWSGLPIPSPVDHILSDLSTMIRPSWVAPQGWLGFIELDKPVVLVWLYWLVFCEYGFSVSALWCPLAIYCREEANSDSMLEIISLTCFSLLLLLQSYIIACLRGCCPATWLKTKVPLFIS